MANTTNTTNLSPGIIIRSAYFDKKHPSRAWMASTKLSHHDHQTVNAKFKDGNFISHKDYSSRKTECTLSKDEWKAGYLAYQNQDFKVTSQGHFTRIATYKSNKEFENSDEYGAFKVPDKSLVWSEVLSFSQEFFTEHHILDKETAAEIVRHTIDDFFRNNGIDPSSMKYAGQFHVDTPHHFHIHLQMHQVRPGCYDKHGQNAKWHTKGKFNQKALKTWKDNIEKYCLAKTARRQKFFTDVLQKRDAIKYSVLETLQNAKDIGIINDLARELKRMLPKEGRLQYNSSNINALTRMKIDTLVNVLIDTGATSKKEWQAFNQEMNGKVDHYTSEIDPTTKQGQMKIKVIEDIRQEKHEEVWSHIANQVIKAVKAGDWRELGKNYTPTSVRRHIAKSRNTFISSLNSKAFWHSLANKSNNEVDKALQSIQNELQKNINEINKNNERSQ